MARNQLNTNGATPLADTTVGTAGTVTGTERSKLQSILAGALSLVTSVADGLMRATDKAKLDASTPANVPNTLMSRDSNGDVSARYMYATSFNGPATSANTASAASALSAGTTDGDKLHGIGTTVSATLASNISNAGNSTVMSLALPPGIWIVYGLVLTSGISSPGRVQLEGYGGPLYSYDYLTIQNTSGSQAAANPVAVAVPGNQSIYMVVYKTGTEIIYGAGSPAYTMMQAVRVG